jgi:hypothetical protein
MVIRLRFPKRSPYHAPNRFANFVLYVLAIIVFVTTTLVSMEAFDSNKDFSPEIGLGILGLVVIAVIWAVINGKELFGE